MSDQQGESDQDRRFGRYRATKVLGRGGMGIVYLGQDPRIGRDVAIKVIRTNPDTPESMRQHLRRRFEVEAQSAGTLSHPNIVTIYDIGEEEDSAYIAMEHVAGESLEDLLRSDRSLSFGEVASLTEQLCGALDYAHAHGVIHRDIKPANILLTRSGQPKIVDFGVAKMSEALGGDETRLTQAGSVIGTPAYMSPEQVTGHEVTAASDQFSLGVIVYEMLAGRVPFEGDGATTVMYKIVHEEAPPLADLDKRLPGRIDAAIAKALAKNPAERYGTCEEFARAVRESLESPVAAAEPAVERTVLLPPGEDVPADGTVLLSSTPVPPADATVLMSGAEAGVGETVLTRGAHVSPQSAPAASRSSSTPRRLLLVLGVVVAVAVVAMLTLGPAEDPSRSLPGPADSPPPAATQPESSPSNESIASDPKPAEPEPAPSAAGDAASAAQASSWWIHIGGNARGAEIWIDGVDTGQSTPDDVELSGTSGQLRSLELRREGLTLASTEFELGPFMPKDWSPRAVAAAERPALADNLFARGIDIRSRPRGAAIWLDGRDTGERTPARLTLEGDVGDRFRVEVRDGATTLDDRTLILGPNMPSEWTAGSEPRFTDAPPPVSDRGSAGSFRTLRVTSRPDGAEVWIDGDRVEGATPLDLDLDLAAQHQIRLELPGHRTASWAFSGADLSDAQRDSGVLHFPLTLDAPPGRLRITAPGYEVTVRINGTSYRAAGSHDIELPAGEYTVEIEAPGAHYSDTRQLRLASDATIDIPLPVLLEVQIAAAPGNCRVTVDGRLVDTTPFSMRISAGDHNFEFFWPALGKTMYEVISITRPGQRVFASVEQRP